MRPINITLAPVAANATQVVATTGTGITTGTSLTIANGVLDVPRQIIVTTSSASDNAQTVTITGTDYSGNVKSEALTTNNVTPAASYGYYSTITKVVYTGSTTVGTIAVGTNGVSSTPVIPLDTDADPTNVALSVQAVGTVTFIGEQTLNDPYALPFDGVSAPAYWSTITGFASGSISVVGNIAFPVRAIRFRITAGSGSINAIVIQSGPIS